MKIYWLMMRRKLTECFKKCNMFTNHSASLTASFAYTFNAKPEQQNYTQIIVPRVPVLYQRSPLWAKPEGDVLEVSHLKPVSVCAWLPLLK